MICKILPNTCEQRQYVVLKAYVDKWIDSTILESLVSKMVRGLQVNEWPDMHTSK